MKHYCMLATCAGIQFHFILKLEWRMLMEDICMSIVLTSSCDLRCTYCINQSGKDLILDKKTKSEWDSAEEVIKCLEDISRIRNIRLIKFFGGEPMLRDEMIKAIILNKAKFNPNGDVQFALTTNAYQEFSTDVLKIMMDNKTIINISLDGPEKLHNAARIAVDKGNTFRAVLKNIEHLKKANYPFALIGVLDERLIEHDTSISDISYFARNISPIHKLDPAYELKTCQNGNGDNSTTLTLLKQAKSLVLEVFHGIRSLDGANYIFENNIIRTMHNILLNKEKEEVCSARYSLALFPNKSVYSCYNLATDKYLVAQDVSKVDCRTLEKNIVEKQNFLGMENFPKEYRDVQFFGDYCPKENNFTSFAYLYRKNMIDCVTEELNKIIPGSPEHLSLLNYLTQGFNHDYFKDKIFEPKRGA